MRDERDLSCPANPGYFRHTDNTMQYLRTFKLIKTIIKSRKLIKPSKWKVSKRTVKNISKRFGTSSRSLRRMEAVVEDKLEQDSFLSIEILDQIRRSDGLHSLHHKKSLKSVIAEAKLELDTRKLRLSEVTEASQNYVDLDEASRRTELAYSDYMEMF